MERCHDPGFPVVVAVFDTFAQSRSFDQYAGIGDVAEFVDGDGRDAKTALPDGYDETLGGESAQRFSQRAGAGLIGFSQILDTQALLRLEYAGDYVGLDPLIRILCKSL
jgi:hypothetical protein